MHLEYSEEIPDGAGPSPAASRPDFLGASECQKRHQETLKTRGLGEDVEVALALPVGDRG
jgi:hypothetical protein